MPVDAHANLAVSTVASGTVIGSSSGTGLTVASGEGARFYGAVPYNIIVWPAATKPTPVNAEFMRVTARSTDALTVSRYAELGGIQSGNTAIAAGYQVAQASTVKTFTDIELSSWKDSVRAATTVNGTDATAFENGDTIDGVVLATGDRILRKNQTTGGENGIYTVNASGAPTRATDCDTAAEITGAIVPVQEGTVNADAVFMNTTNAPITLGTTATVWAYYPSGTELASLPTASLPIAGTDTVPVIQAGVVGQTPVSSILTNVQVFAGTGGTYTKPAGCVAVRVLMISSGSGGGSGRRGATGTIRGGGGGGTGGAFSESIFKASQVGATETVTIPAGGAGGAAASADTTNGNIGVDATTTSFGALMSTVSGFPTLTPGGAGTSAIGGAGGLGIIAGNLDDSPNAGVGSAGAGAAAGAGNGGRNAGGAGGGGGGISAANSASAGAGGGAGAPGLTIALGGTGGATGANPGGTGANSTIERGGGGGGGAGASAGGNQGGDAGTYGAGGGGSSGNTNGSAGARGGNGSAGIVIVISY